MISKEISKESILKYLNELGTELEESYGTKLIILEEKDFKEFTEVLLKKQQYEFTRSTKNTGDRGIC